MWALPHRDKEHLEVIDLDGTVGRGTAFRVEKGVGRQKFRLYSSRIFLLDRVLLGSGVLFIL